MRARVYKYLMTGFAICGERLLALAFSCTTLRRLLTTGRGCGLLNLSQMQHHKTLCSGTLWKHESQPTVSIASGATAQRSRQLSSAGRVFFYFKRPSTPPSLASQSGSKCTVTHAFDTQSAAAAGFQFLLQQTDFC